MKTVFLIDGGAGRIIASIPALEKYIRLHPDEDVKILIGGWDNLVWGNSILQNITYNMDTKGVFENAVKNAHRVIKPEPYILPSYFNQLTSLAEAFDEEINRTNDHSDLGAPKLHLMKAEEKMGANIVADVKAQQQKTKTIVIQPYGRSARLDKADIIDDSSRSLEPKAYISLVKKLAAKYNLIFFGERHMAQAEDTYTFKLESDLRGWAAVIENSDYFIGCDSVGQHMARAFNKPGTVIIGSTFAKNTTYPDFFNIFEKKDYTKVYSPIRIAGLDCNLADRLNDRCMELDDKEINELYTMIEKDIEKKT